MKNCFKILVVSSFITLLSGCATIVNGRYQNVTMVTQPQGATCVLHNNKGTWVVKSTPGTVNVHRSLEDLHISCHLPGYQTGVMTVPSHAKKMLAGNILFGGVVGAAIDSGDGSGFSYPNQLTMNLITTTASQAKPVAGHTKPTTKPAAKKAVPKNS